MAFKNTLAGDTYALPAENQGASALHPYYSTKDPDIPENDGSRSYSTSTCTAWEPVWFG